MGSWVKKFPELSRLEIPHFYYTDILKRHIGDDFPKISWIFYITLLRVPFYKIRLDGAESVEYFDASNFFKLKGFYKY